jgi:hypothetical protein
MHLFELQFAWFFSGITQLDYEKLVTAIRQKTPRTFVSPATFIPLPPKAPPEIPRVQLQMPDNSARISIALARADFFVSSQTAELTSEQIEAFFGDVNSISEILLSATGVSRLGIVARIFKECSEPVNEIAKAFLKRNFANLQEASVKVVERHVVDKFTYNDGYQFDQGIKLDTQNKILVIIRDLNTALEVPLIITKEIIRDFAALSRERLNSKYIEEIMGADHVN